MLGKVKDAFKLRNVEHNYDDPLVYSTLFLGYFYKQTNSFQFGKALLIQIHSMLIKTMHK